MSFTVEAFSFVMMPEEGEKWGREGGRVPSGKT
jgi:hypothetical protein